MVSIFPNPTTERLNIQLPSAYAGNITLQLSAVDGKLISELKPAIASVQLNVQGLPAGTYLISIVKQDGGLETYRFVKQ
jgi:hypothetical protein